jgi:hypothetical protein
MKKNKNKTELQLPLFIQKILADLNQKLKSLSIFLQRKTDIYSVGKKKFFLILFCFIGACGCSILIFCSVRNNDHFYYTVSPIKVLPLLKDRITYPMLSRKELKRIQDFKFYLDTLGVKERDSLFAMRPHLSDSIEMVEAIYRKQLKK